MSNFKSLLYSVSPIVALVAVYSLIMIYRVPWPKELTNNIRDRKWRSSNRPFTYSLLFISLVLPYYFFIGVDALLHSQEQYRYINTIGIFLTILFLQVARLFFQRQEVLGQGNAPQSKWFLGLIKDCALFLSCYTSTLTLDPSYASRSNCFFLYNLSGVLLSVFIVVMIIKYRIYDDIFRYQLYSEQSTRYISQSLGPGHSLMRGMFDHFLRAYLFAAFSFSVLQLCIINNLDSDAFHYSNQSSNILVDFMYFNFVTMATVGYGDIYPKSALAKLLCIGEILFSLFILAVVVTLIVGRYQKLSSTK